MIHADNLTHVYKGPIGKPEKNLLAIDNVSIVIENGSAVALIGDSGSGKTTLLNIISGNLEPTAGLVFVQNHSLYNMRLQDRRRYLSEVIYYVHQDLADNLFLDLTAMENAELFLLSRNMQDHGQFESILSELSLDYIKNIKVRNLSGGEKELLCLALALLIRPQLLILDEPTSALDATNKHRIFNQILNVCKQHGITLLFCTHDPEVAAYADFVVGIYFGRFDRVLAKRLSASHEEFAARISAAMAGDYVEVPINSNGTIHLPRRITEQLQLSGTIRISLTEDKKLLITSGDALESVHDPRQANKSEE